MIERCEILPQNTPENAVTTRIKALQNAYSDTVGVDLLMQTVAGEITAIFGGMDGSYSLFAFQNANFEELDSYFSFLGATVFCFAETSDSLHPESAEKSDLYEFIQETECVENDGHGKISDVYTALKQGEDGDIQMPPFDLWYTDFCIRFNHNAAEYSLFNGATAVAGFMTDFGTLITGVAVPKENRKNGLGSSALNVLLGNIKKKHPNSRVFAATKNAGEFYIKNGFVKVDKVAVCKY